MNKILITGASGFFGSNLIKYLPKKNYKYILLIKKNLTKLNKKRFQQIKVSNFFNKDINFWDDYTSQVDTVIHLAWSINKNYKNSPSNKNFFKVSTDLAYSCKKNNVKFFIGIGSCAEYFWKNKILKTTSPLRSKTNYSKYKTLTYKKLKKIFKFKINFIWLRPFFVYGSKQKRNQFIPNIKNKIKKNKKIIINNSNHELDFIHINDVCRFIVGLIKDKKSNGVYNIGSGNPISIRSFLKEKFPRQQNLFQFKKSKTNVKIFCEKQN